MVTEQKKYYFNFLIIQHTFHHYSNRYSWDNKNKKSLLRHIIHHIIELKNFLNKEILSKIFAEVKFKTLTARRWFKHERPEMQQQKFIS